MNGVAPGAAVRGMAQGRHPWVWLTAATVRDVPPSQDWLTARERALLDGLRFAKRRADWLLGRWVAKQAVAACTGVSDSVIEVIAAGDGAPEAFLRGVRWGGSVSLSHSHARAIAVACREAIPLGCDIERIEPRSERFIQDYFTGAETEFVMGLPAVHRHLAVNLIWSVKESALKATRQGLRADTRSIAVELNEGLVLLRADGWRPLRLRGALGRGLYGQWCVAGGSVCTVVAERPVTIGPANRAREQRARARRTGISAARQ